MLLTQLMIGAAAIAATAIIHGLFMAAALGWLKAREARGETRLHRAVVVTGVVLWYFLSICVQCLGWAVLLMMLGALHDLETALYFATVTFTTVGYGDVILDTNWRLLGAFASAAGMIIFGWTTALVFAVVQREYLDPNRPPARSWRFGWRRED